MLTPVDGEGQQCIAAPACTASIELDTNGSLEISALAKIKFLKEKKKCTIRYSFRLSNTMKEN